MLSHQMSKQLIDYYPLALGGQFADISSQLTKLLITKTPLIGIGRLANLKHKRHLY